jgi:hypothetical protein
MFRPSIAATLLMVSAAMQLPSNSARTGASAWLLHVTLPRQRGRGLLRNHGVHRLRRMDAVPEQELVGAITNEGCNAGRDTRGRHVRQSKRRRLCHQVVEQPVRIEPHDPNTWKP